MLKNQKQPGVKMIELFLFRVLTPQPKLYILNFATSVLNVSATIA